MSVLRFLSCPVLSCPFNYHFDDFIANDNDNDNDKDNHKDRDNRKYNDRDIDSDLVT